MGSKTLVYNKKLEDNLKESKKHLLRLEIAFEELSKKFKFPINNNNYKILGNSNIDLAFCDQCIYRFSKLQDSMGAKLFKSLLLSQGETVDKPFIDILNQLEKIDIINVDEWFEIRDLRNEIAHEYDENSETVINILNSIFDLKDDLEFILTKIAKSVL